MPKSQIELAQQLSAVHRQKPATACREAHPRIWRQATKDQRREILAKYQETGSIRKAFASIKAYRVTDADMQWFGVRLGGGR